jgi:hypothetical protein
MFTAAEWSGSALAMRNFGNLRLGELTRQRLDINNDYSSQIEVINFDNQHMI